MISDVADTEYPDGSNPSGWNSKNVTTSTRIRSSASRSISTSARLASRSGNCLIASARTSGGEGQDADKGASGIGWQAPKPSEGGLDHLIHGGSHDFSSFNLSSIEKAGLGS